MVENFDQKSVETRGGKYKNQRVFTEQGVAMLATIIRTSPVVEANVKTTRVFI